MGSNSKKSLSTRIQRGKETRDAMVESNLSQGIAFQIAATRDAQGLTQAELADRAGISNNLPRLEDPEYGKHTLSTLKKLASALDVALVVRLVPFSQYIDWLSGTPYWDEGLRPEALAVPSFDEESSMGRYADSVSGQWALIRNVQPHSVDYTKITTPDVNGLYKSQTPLYDGNELRMVG